MTRFALHRGASSAAAPQATAGPSHLPIRESAIAAFLLVPGHRMLDDGFGTGLNLALLQQGVGQIGRVAAVGIKFFPPWLDALNAWVYLKNRGDHGAPRELAPQRPTRCGAAGPAATMGAVLVVIAGLADAAFRWPVFAKPVMPIYRKQTSLLGATAIAASGRLDVSAFVRIAVRRRASGASRTRGAVAPRPRPPTQLRRAAALRVLCYPHHAHPVPAGAAVPRRPGAPDHAETFRRAPASARASREGGLAQLLSWTTCGCSSSPTVGWPLSSASASRARLSASSSATTSRCRQ